MSRKIRDIINRLNVKINYSSWLDRGGYYIPKLNMIFINSSLSDFEQEKNLLHELGHAAHHRNESAIYKTVSSMHCAMEYEANYSMIEALLNEYMDQTGLEPYEVNYVNFIEESSLSVRYEFMVEKLLREKMKMAQ